MNAKMKISDKAMKLVEEGRASKTLVTNRRVHYKVQGETEEHSVIFDSVKNDWACDCRFFALRDKECSHIAACKLLRTKEEFSSDPSGTQ